MYYPAAGGHADDGSEDRSSTRRRKKNSNEHRASDDVQQDARAGAPHLKTEVLEAVRESDLVLFQRGSQATQALEPGILAVQRLLMVLATWKVHVHKRPHRIVAQPGQLSCFDETPPSCLRLLCCARLLSR